MVRRDPQPTMITPLNLLGDPSRTAFTIAPHPTLWGQDGRRRWLDASRGVAPPPRATTCTPPLHETRGIRSSSFTVSGLSVLLPVLPPLRLLLLLPPLRPPRTFLRGIYALLIVRTNRRFSKQKSIFHILGVMTPFRWVNETLLQTVGTNVDSLTLCTRGVPLSSHLI